ncbi:neogenin-like isoform X1 [Brevipalpus obovatus]|uniref:neogenin-like isoform X1 n=1 Tax=Brevipalpus obovatus TaxID=246614 RepID=UPI003D9ECF5C
MMECLFILIFVHLITNIHAKNDPQSIGEGDDPPYRRDEYQNEDIPHNITVETDGSSSLLIKWDPPNELGDDAVITGYKIKYKVKGSDKKPDTIQVEGNQRSYQLIGLKKNTQYTIKIAAIVNNQTQPYSDWITGETAAVDLDESRPPGQLNGKVRLEATSNSITVNWQAPKDRSILIRGYTIGWGVGVPDTYTKVLSPAERSFVLNGLESTYEYVVSVRAFNKHGDGPPIYETIWTRVATTPEPKLPLQPPVGLSANVLSSSTVLLSWTDTSLPSRTVSDNRLYTVRYTSKIHSSSSKYKYINTTKQNLQIDDLKPFTAYEFVVKIIRGKKETAWSMSVINVTHEAIPSSPPEDFTTVASQDDDPTMVNLVWQSPKQANGQTTGYVILYTTNRNAPDKEWAIETVPGDQSSTTLHSLTQDTTYYFKIQARNKKGYGPLSQPLTFRTHKMGKKPLQPNSMVLMIASISGTVVILMVVVSILMCRSKRYSPGTPKSPVKRHKGYIATASSPLRKSKNGKDLNPLDLWIHQNDQIELKGLDKCRSNLINDISIQQQNPEEMPLNVSISEDKGQNNGPFNDLFYDDVNKSPTPASDSISFASGSSTARRAKTKSMTISTDSQGAGSLGMPNGNLNFEPPPLSRTLYPPNQLNIQRTHLTLERNDIPITGHHFYDPVTSLPMQMNIAGMSGNNFTNQITPNISYSSTNGFNLTASPNTDTLSKRATAPQPLKSFSAPSPQNGSSMVSPQFPYPSSNFLNGFSDIHPPNNSSIIKEASGYFAKPPPLLTSNGRFSLTEAIIQEDDFSSSYSTDEFNQEKSNLSTVEFNQEQANLERVMKDLDALAKAGFNVNS